ncbi:MAG TPA: glutamine-hydrolyzing GMP synthase [Armatimonadota bacterium]|nr:glutamine-hydrolyzing GMP synthase [Armatimonadota bacterium]
MDNLNRLQEHVVVIDFGAQYSQLIARRIRECNVYCEILPYDTPAEELAARKPKGIVLSGGPSSVYEEDAPHPDPRIFELGIPVLGICYGMQLMGYNLGGNVGPGDKREYGKTELKVVEGCDLFYGLDKQLIGWMSHGDSVKQTPEGFQVIARTANTSVAAMANPIRRLYAVQFHPEVVHTPKGKQILENFLYRVCECKGDWTMESFIKLAVEGIRRQVGKGKVILAMSGGVDSSAAAILIHKAIGDQLTSIFVDNGLLRKGEPETVAQTFRDKFGLKLVVVDAEDRFLNALAGVTDPEKKRNIIGREFVRIFEEEAAKLGDVDFLAQGTIYPDVIESGSKVAATIKSHHNVGGLPEDMKLQLVEPLRQLFKDEVRRVCEELGLPEEIAWRQPFPGPGLAVRIIGEVTKERLDVLREADAIVLEEIKNAGLYRSIWQAFAVLLAIRSVGVMGDARTYAHPIVLRAVTSDDAMTADWAKLPYELLERISNRIINEVKGVNRVLYDISSKPPATIEWE